MKYPVVTAACLMLLTACSSDPVPITTSYTLNIISDDSINPYRTSNANPVVVRVYQLASKESFEQSSFIALYNTDRQTLGASLVMKQVLPPVLPNNNSSITLDINKKTQYLATLVEYANYQKSNGKALTLMPTDGNSSFQLRLSGLSVELDTVAPKSSWWQIF